MPDIVHQLDICVPENKIFEAVSSPTGLNSWWTLEAKGMPCKGSEYHLYFGPQYDWRAVVSDVTLDKSIHYRVTQAMDDWLHTVLEFELFSAEPNKCKLRFSHRGWAKESEHYAISSYCWAVLLLGLKNYVEKDIVVPFEHRN